MKKIRKNIWEEIFAYPSFNIRFTSVLLFVLLTFCLIGYYCLFYFNIVSEISNQIALINLLIQSATLVLGIFAAYYALRQLVETRFTGLNSAATRELKYKHYASAIQKWKEAFYIRPEPSVFLQFCEAFLLIGDYESFDYQIKITQNAGFFKNEIFTETSDKIVLLYLKAIRHLLVKNQGEAEKYISELISLINNDGFPNTNWDFIDLQTSEHFLNLTGECKNIGDNLISFLQKTILPKRKSEFEDGNFASQITE